MRIVLLCLILMVSLLGPSAWSQPAQTGTKVKAEGESKEGTKKKKLGVDQSDFMPDANSFGFVSSYFASYNQMEEVDQKTVAHNLSLAMTYSFDKHWSSYAAIGFSHESYGNNIVRNNDNDQFHNMSNLNFGAVYSKMDPLSFVHRSSNTFNVSLPVSEQSRVDKHVTSLSLTNFSQSHTWKNFSLFNRFSGNFLWNTQKFSMFNDDTMNRDWLVSDSLGINYMITPRFGARFNFRADMVRYLDDSWNLSFGSNFSLFANVSGFQIFASMINNSYPENERIDVGYYDRYQRLFLGGVTYAF